MSQHRPPPRQGPYDGPRQPYYQPPPYQPPQPPHYVQHVHYHQAPAKSAGVAALLEVLPGLFLQTFGIGHLYAGNVALGLLFMFGYWFLTFVNILLCFVLIGFITWPICFVITIILSPILAANAANAASRR
jgi:TM2 domain-containing membrane protein YozV